MSAERASQLQRLVGPPARLPRRADRSGHKGTFGTVALLAGSDGMLGAAILAARGALRGGAGLVRAVLPHELMAPFTVAVPAATTVDRDAEPDPMLADVDAFVCGPGLPPGVATAWLRSRALSLSQQPAVLDAGALVPETIDVARDAGCHLLLTPHPGEAARLLGVESAVVQRDRGAAVSELTRRFAPCVVVLKGAGTLVCDGARIYENTTGNPGLGTGGTGDVLAGLLGALLAQGMSLFEAACFGVHVHGGAGDLVASRLSEPGLCAEDLPLAIAEVLRDEIDVSDGEGQ